jgi:hypothetical protein
MTLNPRIECTLRATCSAVYCTVLCAPALTGTFASVCKLLVRETHTISSVAARAALQTMPGPAAPVPFHLSRWC